MSFIYRPEGFTSPICKITDADGICALVKLRLHGIDAPEEGQPGYAIAVQFLDKVIDKSCIYKMEGADVYNRILVTIYKRTDNINRQMVEKGLAWSICPEYADIEAAARLSKKGIWAYKKPNIAPWVWRKLYPRVREKNVSTIDID